MFHLAWDRLGIPKEELDSVAGEGMSEMVLRVSYSVSVVSISALIYLMQIKGAIHSLLLTSVNWS